MKHYLEIKLLEKSNSFSKSVAEIMSAFHGAMRCYGENSPIAIAFPKIVHHVSPLFTSFGNVIRFFGHKADLSMWLSNPVFDKLEESFSIEISPIRETPENCDHVRYVRDSTVDRNKKAKLDHLIKCHYPMASLKSKTNGHRYSIRVKMVSLKEPLSGTFNAFGLSNGKNPGSVPFF